MRDFWVLVSSDTSYPGLKDENRSRKGARLDDCCILANETNKKVHKNAEKAQGSTKVQSYLSRNLCHTLHEATRHIL